MEIKKAATNKEEKEAHLQEFRQLRDQKGKWQYDWKRLPFIYFVDLQEEDIEFRKNYLSCNGHVTLIKSTLAYP